MAGPSSAAHPPLDSCGGPTNWNGTHACAGRPCRRREGVGQASGPTARQSRLRLARPHSLNFFTGEKGGNAGSAGRPGPTRPRQGSHAVPYFLAFIAFFMAFFAGAAAGAAAFFIAFMACCCLVFVLCFVLFLLVWVVLVVVVVLLGVGFFLVLVAVVACHNFYYH